VDFLHGKLKGKEKDEKMKKFADGKTNILVSTSVVEVGVNIPNASVMMIEGSERFGLAQLHQFRGRVGRSNFQSYCFLMSENPSLTARDRLRFFEKTLDGFVLSEYDLETRGPGEVYGTSQSGMMNLRLATLQDNDIIREAREIARGIDFEKFGELKEKVKQWEEKIHLE
jgi:ATP-dependent DNA helicase RecG